MCDKIDSYPPPADDSHTLGNNFVCVDVISPFVEPWPIGISRFVVIVIALTISLVNDQVVILLAAGNALADMSGSGHCVLVEVFIPLHKLQDMLVWN